MKKYFAAIFLCVVLFFVVPHVSHAAWWQYVNDKTLISFLKSLFIEGAEFTPYKNGLSWADLDTSKKTDDVTLAHAVASAKQAATNVSDHQQALADTASGITSMVDGPVVNVIGTQYNASDPSHVSVSAEGVALKATADARSSWISFVVSLPQRSNYVYFDLDFTSTEPAQGIVTGFFDSINLGYFDERFYGAGMQRQVLGFAPAEAGTSHVITLRLDQSGTEKTSVMIKNIGTGFFTE